MSSEVPVIILIIAVPVYFLCLWVLKRKNVGNSKNRPFVAVLPALVLSPFVYAGLIFLWLWSASWYIPSDFDQKEWRENSEERYRMSGDLIDSEMLIGLTRQEVIDLLGEGSEGGHDCLHYYVGYPPGFMGSIDPDILKVCFEAGKVKEVTQYTS